MITSANNTQVKNIIQLNQKAKARREQGLFVAEGRKMFGEAPNEAGHGASGRKKRNRGR